MIEHLTPQQARPVRRRLIADIVYVVFHDALKAWHQEGKTHLTPPEIYLSARNLCDAILGLPDAEEGFEDELDDLETEADDTTDAMLVEMMAASMMDALTARQGEQPGQEPDALRPVIIGILQRWCAHELFDGLVAAGCRKEDARYAQGKRSDLMHYELLELEQEGAGDEEIRQFIDQLLDSSAYGKSPETIKETIIVLCRFNLTRDHRYDSQLIELYKKLDGTPQGVIAGGDNKGLMAGGDVNVGIHPTDRQMEMMIKSLAAGGGKQPLLGTH